MRYRVAGRQSVRQKVEDVVRWERLGGKKPASCLAMTKEGGRCKVGPSYPEGGALYCGTHYKKFLEILERTRL